MLSGGCAGDDCRGWIGWQSWVASPGDDSTGEACIASHLAARAPALPALMGARAMRRGAATGRARCCPRWSGGRGRETDGSGLCDGRLVAQVMRSYGDDVTLLCDLCRQVCVRALCAGGQSPGRLPWRH